MTNYGDALTALYQQPLAIFVAERKRLASALKAAGDKAGAATFAKLPRPPVSAWAVNQLWWHARTPFDALLTAAARVRDGELAAAVAHRAALAALRVRAAAVLVEHGHGATEGTLRRIALTLAAIGARGGFAPDPPGALTDDRDPPGFESMAGAAASPPPSAPPPPAPPPTTATIAPRPRLVAVDDDFARAREAEAAAQAVAHAAREAAREAAAAAEAVAAEAAAVEAAAVERARREQAEAKRRDRHRLDTALARASADAEQQSRELERLRLLASTAAAELADARRRVAALTAELARLD